VENSLDNLGKPTPPAGYAGWSIYSHLGRGGLKRPENGVISANAPHTPPVPVDFPQSGYTFY